MHTKQPNLHNPNVPPSVHGLYSNHNRGTLPSEADGLPREATHIFLRALHEDLEGLAHLALYQPQELPHTSAVDLLRTLLAELARLSTCSELFPHKSSWEWFMREACRKVHVLERVLRNWPSYWTEQNRLHRYMMIKEAGEERPVDVTGLAPWSQFLAQGAPGVDGLEERVSGGRMQGADAVQVIPPTGASLLQQWEEEYEDIALRMGVEMESEDEDDDEGMEKETIGWHEGGAVKGEHERDGPHCAFPLSDLNNTIQRVHDFFELDEHDRHMLDAEDDENAILEGTMTVVCRRRVGQRKSQAW